MWLRLVGPRLDGLGDPVQEVLPWLTAGVLLDVGVLATVAAGWPAALF